MSRQLHLLLQALLVALTLGGALAFAVEMATWPDHPLADMTHLAWWTQLVQHEGIARAYDGTYPETYVIYPPGMVYAFAGAGWLEAHVAPPPWVPPGAWLHVAIKLVAIAGHGVLALALFAVVAAAGGFWRGWLASALYAWSPAALFDAGYWGQPDTLHTALLVLALGAIFAAPAWWPVRGRAGWRLGAQAGALLAGAAAGALLAAASLTKPQAWVFLPLVGWLLWRRLGPAGLAAAGAAAGALAWWIALPWLRSGRLGDLLTVFGALPQVMPSVSANGDNLWWLKLPGGAIAVLDWQPIGGIGPWLAPPYLTFATVGRLAFGLFALLPLLRLTGPLSVRLALAGAGYTAVAYFMTITQVHENHLFAAVPLLAGAAALDSWLLLPFALTSTCAFLNLALHDFLIGDSLAALLGARLPWFWARDALALQTANAALNVAGFALLTVLLLRRPPALPQPAHALRQRARAVLAAGCVLSGGALGAALAILLSPSVAQWLWNRMTASVPATWAVEAKLGRHSPPEVLLAHAAVGYANLLVTLLAAAAITGTLAAVAGAWWLLCARVAPRAGTIGKTEQESMDRAAASAAGKSGMDRAASASGMASEGQGIALASGKASGRHSPSAATGAPLGAPRSLLGLRKLRLFLEAIKFEHTIFALPFAYLGMLLAARGVPAPRQLIWITVAMASARTLAMALNRLIDREIDARNPRTANRALPRRLLSAGEMATFAAVSAVVLAIAAWQLNPLCVQLLPGAVIVLAGYSYTKRFTWLSHAVLGIADACAPVGAWAAVTGFIPPPAVLLGFAVATWIGGFDLLYACQDVEFDRAEGLHSVPARFGVAAALRAAKVAHALTVAALVAAGVLLGLGAIYWLGVLAAAALLVYEHSLLAPHDLSRLDLAFFNVNGYIAVILFLATAGDLALRWLLQA